MSAGRIEYPMQNAPSSRQSGRIARILGAFALVAACFTASSGLTATGGTDCLRWADAAARKHGVPLGLMRAIAAAESGKRQGGELLPWPWAVNTAGTGHWFLDRDAALDFIRAQVASGRTNVDIGCFQLNYRWHHEAFPSLERMLDPAANADYAGRFLRRLHAEFGNWEGAAKAYHSRTPEFADAYFSRLGDLGFGTERRTEVGARPAPAPTPTPSGPAPLFASGSVALGSLVPVTPRAASPAMWWGRRP